MYRSYPAAADQTGSRSGGRHWHTGPAMRPAATYRVQLHPGFGFDDAAAWCRTWPSSGYHTSTARRTCRPPRAAPTATTSSTLTDSTTSSAAARARAAGRAAGRAGLGQVLDIVPNHMALAGRANRWWWDVLENGPASRYATYFDIDWDRRRRERCATVLVPVLGDHYGRVLEAGELQVDTSSAVVCRPLPRPRGSRCRRARLDDLLARAAARGRVGGAGAAGRRPRSPARGTCRRTRRRSHERQRRQGGACSASWPSCAGGDPRWPAPSTPRSRRSTPIPTGSTRCCDRQNYRLAYWRTAARSSTTAASSTSSPWPACGSRTPRCSPTPTGSILDWSPRAPSTGCGSTTSTVCATPRATSTRLREATGRRVHGGREDPRAPGEDLPDDWPVAGTSGYDFLIRVNNLFVDRANETGR